MDKSIKELLEIEVLKHLPKSVENAAITLHSFPNNCTHAIVTYTIMGSQFVAAVIIPNETYFAHREHIHTDLLHNILATARYAHGETKDD